MKKLKGMVEAMQREQARIIAHDLNNVFGGIRLNLHHLSEKNGLDPETLEVLKELQASCARGSALVSDLFKAYPE